MMMKDKVKHNRHHHHHIGTTDLLGYFLVLLLAAGLLGGFYLALKSIVYNYTGQLLCYTVVFTPLGTAIAIVLGKIVDKNRDENTGPNGEGIKYSTAQANHFVERDYQDDIASSNSIPI